MTTSDMIPKRTAARFPVYLRTLLRLKAMGYTTVSSKELAENTLNNPAQIRKDLSFMGELGTRGLGYDIDYLINELKRRLSLRSRRSVIVVGSHLKNYPFWLKYINDPEEFEILGLFECDPHSQDLWFQDIPIYKAAELRDYLSFFSVDIAIVTSVDYCEMDMIGELTALGIKAVLNLTPISLKTPPGVVCRQIDLSSELQLLSYYLSEGETQPQLQTFEHV